MTPAEPVKPVVVPDPPRRHVVEEPVNKPLIANSRTPDISVAPEKPKKSKHEIKVDLSDQISAMDAKRARAKAQKDAEERQERADAQRRDRITTALQGAGKGLSSKIQSLAGNATVVDLPGQGGGAAFANYRSIVYNAYLNAWNPPHNVDSEAEVETEIVIARDGSIISADVVKRSGVGPLDRSVERAMREVRKLAPFPEESKVSQRRFGITFSLKAKQSLG